MQDRDREILEFEKQHWAHESAKHAAIRDLFDMTATRYAQILVRLISDPDAWLAEPQLMARLQRRVSARRRIA